MEVKHPNSREISVFLFTGTPFIQIQQTVNQAEKGDQPYFIQSRATIGSYFKPGTNGSIGTGLLDWEVALLLPSIVDLPSDDREFWKAVNNFYRNISTSVTPEGLTLEIGLIEDNDMPIQYKNNGEKVNNMPINIYNYVIYRHLIKHPSVAKSFNEAKEYGGQKMWFILDRIAESKLELAKLENRKLADEIYYKVVADKEQIRMFLILAGVVPNQLSEIERKIKLKEIADADPQKIIDIENSPNSKSILFVSDLLELGILNTAGSRILISENNVDLGGSKTEAALTIFDKKSVELKNRLMALKKDATK